MFNLADWQKRFRATQKIWFTYFMEGNGFQYREINSYYDSKKAAELECDWYKRRGKKAPRIGSANVHTLELASELWGPVDSAVEMTCDE